jgi:intracellular multiplication protein IcmL
MIGNRHEIARFQSDFYRDSYHKMLIALLLSIVVMLGLIAAIIYVVFTQPKPQYYATTTSGQIIPMTPHT